MTEARLVQLHNLIIKAKQSYYFGGEPIMSDAEYDALEAQLRALVPDDPLLATVGAPVPADSMLEKARHRIPMGSQNKVNTREEFLQWFAKTARGTAVHATLKGDGASAAAYYDAGRLRQVITRGDGVEGEDITANAAKFKGLPVVVGDLQGRPFSGAVRLEVILTVEDWGKVDPARAKNPRNRGNGIMGRKNGQQAELLSAYAFDIEEETDAQAPELATESQKLSRLSELGFQVIPNQTCPTAESACAYFQGVTAERDALPFWIDGVVFKVEDLALQRSLGVTANRPKGQVAWKFDSQGAETIVRDYSVTVGHTGALIPTAHLEPVEIGGTTVSNALLNNWDEIARLDVAVNDRVWLIKANDIIPKIIEVRERPLNRKLIQAPSQCPACGGGVARRRNTGGAEGAVLECLNDECDAKAIGKLKRWIKSLDIDGIGDVVRHAMVEQLGVSDPAGLYELRQAPERLAELVINREADLRLGTKRAQRILASVEQTRELTLIQFIGSLGIERLAQRRVELMVTAAQGELDTVEDFLAGKLRDTEFAAKVGVPTVGTLIQDSIDAQAEVISRLLDNGVKVTGTGVSIAEQPAGIVTVCISGKLPSGKKKADYVDPLLVRGYRLVDSVTRDLRYLVLADPTSNSSKAKKAREYGVEVIGETELIALLMA